MIDWDEVKFYVSIVGLFALVIGGAMAAARASCDAMTADIGLPARWSPFGACQVEAHPGQWIPLDNYRWFGDGQ